MNNLVWLVGRRHAGINLIILQNSKGKTYSVPTVPAIPRSLSPYAPPAGSALAADDRFHNKIEWYVRPVVFGGDPQLEANIIWVNHDEHAQLVKYWNSLYGLNSQ